MTPNPSEQLYEVLFHEQQECWYIATQADQPIQLSRASLQQLVSLYNEIHRGNPLTLVERRTMEQLGEERRELHDTVRQLYDYIDDEASAGEKDPIALTHLGSPPWWYRLGSAVHQRLTQLLRDVG